MESKAGAGFTIKSGTIVVASASGETLHWVTDLVTSCTGKPTRVQSLATLAAATSSIVVTRKRSLPAEGYEIETSEARCDIRYGDDAGLFYAVQTLRQLLPPEIESTTRAKEARWTIPAVSIKDSPRFSWRGMHLDVSRHFFPVHFIKKYIDYAAMHKMNVFHWHLIDDGGWRMESKKYPSLTDVGAWRAGRPGQWSYSDIRMLFDPNERPRYGGYYTRDEIKDVVAYAADRFVTVVPEIEMPGHTTPSIVVFPDLGCDNSPAPSERGRTVTNVYCPGKERTFEFLQDVLTETMELFPSKWIHIGGDEVDKRFWHNCPACQKRMADLGLKDENELQSYFIKRIEKFLVSKGRRLIGWDEILEGGLAPEATVMSWRGVDGGIAAAKAGHDVVMSPTSHCYFDYSYESISTEHVYGWEPVPSTLTAEEGKHVLGGQANVWTEWIASIDRCEYMIFPRMLATAEVLWTPVARRDWSSFSSRLLPYFARLDVLGVNYQIPAPRVEFSAAVFRDRETISAIAPSGTPFKLRYTTDGSDPTPFSTEYTGPVAVDKSQRLSFALVASSGRVGDVVRVDCVKTVPVSADGLTNGIRLEVFEGKWSQVPDFSTLAPVRQGVASSVDLSMKTREEEFAIRFSGFVKIDNEGTYRFKLGSDDGSYLVIAGAKVIDNDGLHGYVEREGAVRLAPGIYPFEIGFFEAGGAERLTFSSTPNVTLMLRRS